MHIKKILILAFSLCFFYQPLIADTESQISLKILYEKCADKTFKNQYGNQYIDYHLQNKGIEYYRIGK